ncbi:hypothetical protein Slin14017_G061390 [Septoria linicola]|nr:hypothetical protein Slin14017_G061390 [Septoria linicola]
MSTSTPNSKKPPIPAAARRTPTAANTTGSATANSNSAAPGRQSPSRMSSSGTTNSAPTGALNRTRSTRNGAPMSARAAARGKTAAVADSAAEEDAKAELAARMDELQQKLQEAERACEESQKQAAVLQVKLDEARHEQGMLEESVHEHTERINDLENEKKESLRARREMEQIYESEKEAAMREKEEAVTREEEMQAALQRMKETLAQREMRAGLDDERRPMMSRHSSNPRSANGSPNPDSSDRQFAPSSISRSDSTSRMNSKLVNQKDKIIEGLRLELAEAQIKLVEVENQGGGRMQEIQKQLYDVKMHNARLMEENESFQLLLSEKTLQGDFLRAPSHNDGSRPSSQHMDTAAGTSLADELDSHADESEVEGDTRRLQAEINGLKDANKALTLYINNIISRLLQHDQFEAILDKTPDLIAGPGAISRRQHAADTDKELPPPPSEQEEQPSLLQRAKSVMGGNKPRPRPLSQSLAPSDKMEPPLRTPGLNEDPSTAPSVPLARAKSTRASLGHRRANSEWPAASVVTNMYRGPSPNSGPLSPGLTSPINRNSFFGRAPSGSQVPTITENNVEKENARDSKTGSTASNHNSVVSNSGYTGLDDDGAATNGLGNERSNPSSPPRSTASSGDKDKQSGAVMMGSKPRPLRLVQEAADETAAKKQANRGSWFGWMNKGGAPPPGTSDLPQSPPAGGVGQGLGEKLGGVFGQRKSESEASGGQAQ